MCKKCSENSCPTKLDLVLGAVIGTVVANAFMFYILVAFMRID